MNIEVLARGAFGSALVTLQPGEVFISESGAMFRASSNVDIDVTTKSRGKGGILAGIKRLVGGDHFFFSTYRVTDGSPGEVGLAPTLQGEVQVIDVDPSIAWLCAGASYMGSSEDLAVDTQFQGFKGFFSGESLFFLKGRTREFPASRSMSSNNDSISAPKASGTPGASNRRRSSYSASDARRRLMV